MERENSLIDSSLSFIFHLIIAPEAILTDKRHIDIKIKGINPLNIIKTAIIPANTIENISIRINFSNGCLIKSSPLELFVKKDDTYVDPRQMLDHFLCHRLYKFINILLLFNFDHH